jgi:hypothetical protein
MAVIRAVLIIVKFIHHIQARAPPQNRAEDAAKAASPQPLDGGVLGHSAVL